MKHGKGAGMTSTWGKRLFFCLAGVGVLLFAGCESVGMRFKERSVATVPEKVAKPFALEKVELVCQACRQNPRYIEGDVCYHMAESWRDGNFGKELTRRAETRYPQLFSRDPKAIPCTVSIAYLSQDKPKELPLLILTLGLAGMVFPCWPPHEFHQNFDITLDAGEDRVFGKTACSACEFKSISLYTPFALLGVPGESDIPKQSGVVASQNKEFQERKGEAILDELVEAIAAVLVKTDPASLPARRPKPGAVREVPLPDTLQLPNF